MNEDVEKWIEELLKNGTFESREDIYEFCVYAVKTFCETTHTDRKAIIEGIKNTEKTGGTLLLKEPVFPIKLKNWKEELDRERDDLMEWGKALNQEDTKGREEFLNAVKEVNEGKYDKDAPVPGISGELVGHSDEEASE